MLKNQGCGWWVILHLMLDLVSHGDATDIRGQTCKANSFNLNGQTDTKVCLPIAPEAVTYGFRSWNLVDLFN